MTQKEQFAFDILAQKLDNRDSFFEQLKEYKSKYGIIPHPYGEDPNIIIQLAEYTVKGSWRKDRVIVKALQKAAKRTARNEK